MKKTIKSFLVAAAALFAFTACTEEPALDDLGGKYPAPDNYTMNTLLFEERVQGESVHNFNLIVATEGLTLEGETYSGNGAALSLKLLDNKSTLTTQSYTAAAADKAKKGNYLIGEGGSQLLVVENGTVTPKNIVSGEVIVTLFQEQYNLYGTLWLADESIAKFDATIDLPNHGDLVVKTKLTKVLSVAKNNGILTINLGTSKVESAPNAYGGVDMTGEGNYLALDIYSADGFLYEGTYTPSAQGGTVGAGEYGIGWDPGDIYNIGWAFTDWGTCWWTIGTPNTAVKILEGNIEVTKKNGKYTISYLYGDIWFEFTGAIADVDPDGGNDDGGDTDTTEYTELTKLMSAQSNVPNAPSITINMASADLEWEYNAATWSNEFKTDGYYLAMDIYTADGKLYTGSYVANTVGGELAEGQFGIGYDNAAFGDWGVNWGTCWWTVEGGAKSAQKVLAGEVDVLVMGENLVIKLRSEVVNAKFTCPVADFKDGQGNAIEVVNNAPATPEEPEFDGEKLTQLMSAQSNVPNAPSITINMASEELEWEYNAATWSNEFKTDGYYLAMDIYTADGKLYTGSYVANTVGGELAEGQFGIGYDNAAFGDWGVNWGTCWWTVEGGAKSAEKVLDGTVEVEVRGENLVITLESEVVNAQFIYPVAEFKDGQGNAIEVVNGAPSVPETPDTPVVPSEPNDDDTEYVELSVLMLAQVNSDWSTGTAIPVSVSLNMAQEGVSITYDAANNWAPVYHGEGNYLSIDLYTTDGKIHTGSYVANTVGGVLAEGQFGIGYDKPEWGGYNWGTCWWTVADGAATPEKVLDGEVDVLVVGENLVIKLRSTVTNAKFTYPVADIKDGQGNAIEVI